MANAAGGAALGRLVKRSCGKTALEEILPGDQNALAVTRRSHCSRETYGLEREYGVMVIP
jgi:hypothetical protein